MKQGTRGGSNITGLRWPCGYSPDIHEALFSGRQQDMALATLGAIVATALINQTSSPSKPNR